MRGKYLEGDKTKTPQRCCHTNNKRYRHMDSWVLTTFLILTLYMLVHAGAAYLRRELKRKSTNGSARQ